MTTAEEKLNQLSDVLNGMKDVCYTCAYHHYSGDMHPCHSCSKDSNKHFSNFWKPMPWLKASLEIISLE